MPITTEYAQVTSGLVTWVIVADAAHIATRADGTWILTPSHVENGYSYLNGIFAAPLPATLAARVGGPLSLSVKAVSSSALTYQWQLGGVPISGATSSSYSVASAASANAGSYTCVITGTGGSLTTSASIVTVV